MNKQIVVRGLLVSYTQTGESGPVVLFLHGWRSNKEVWSKVQSQLSIVNCQLFAIDFPGFGGSEMPKQPMTVGDYAAVVAEFIKKLDLKNVYLVGHSFGGRVGIKLASQHPELVSKLVLVDSAGFAMDPARKSFMNAAAKVAKPFFKPKFMQGLRRKIYKNIGAEDYVATSQLRQTFVNITSEDLTSDMKNIKALTLIINGENDKDTPVELGKRMNALIPNSKFQILANAGHFSFLDQPKELLSLLGKFIIL